MSTQIKSKLATDFLVSVIMPTYNGEKYLEQAINSVLQQTYDRWELIICDDCSKDGTINLLKKYDSDSRIKVHLNPKNTGIFPNLNRCIDLAIGKYIIILGQDDYLQPDAIKSNSELLELYPMAGLLLTSELLVDEFDKPIYIEHSKAIFFNSFSEKIKLLQPIQSIPILLKYGCVGGNITGYFFKKEICKVAGFFREDWKYAADWEWLCRVFDSTPVLFSKDVSMTIRLHAEQASNDRTPQKNNEANQVNKWLLSHPLLYGTPDSLNYGQKYVKLLIMHSTKFFLRGRWQEGCELIKSIFEITSLLNAMKSTKP